VKAGGGLVEDVEGPARRLLGELPGELDALGLAPGERGRGLAELHVAEADLGEGAEPREHPRLVGEDLQCLGDREIEDLGDRQPLEADPQGGLVESLPLAHLAGDEDVGQEVHLDPAHAVSLAGLAAPALHVEGEAPPSKSVDPRLGGHREDLADPVEHLGVGGGIAAGGTADRPLIDVDHLVDVLCAQDAPVGPGDVAAPVEEPAQGREEHRIHESALPRAGDAGHRDQGLKGKGDVHALQIVLARALDPELPSRAAAPPAGGLDREPPGEILAGERARGSHQPGRGSGEDHLAARDAGTRAEIHHVVGGADGLGVVLDDDHGVADVAQARERVEEPAVVALVKADRGLVEDVEDAGQLASDLARQADALALPAGERGARPIQGQVAEPDVDQESQPTVDLLQHLLGDAALGRTQGKAGEELARLADGVGAELGKAPSADRDRGRFGAQPPSLAARAHRVGEVAHVVPAHALGLGLPKAAVELVQHALEGAHPLDLPGREFHGHGDLPALRAVQQEVAMPLRELVPGPVEVDAVHLGEVVEDRARPALGALDHLRPGLDGPLPHAAARVGDHQIRIHLRLGAEPVAVGTHPDRGVEGEALGSELGKAEVAVMAVEVLGVEVLLAACDVADQEAVPLAERGLHRVGEARAVGGIAARRRRQPVHHHVDGVLPLLVEDRKLVGAEDLAVDPEACESLADGLLQELAVLALAVIDDAGEEHEAARGGERQDALADLLGGEALDGAPAAVAVLAADAREEHAEVVVHLGDGAHRRAGIVAGRLLLDADGRGEPADVIVPGLLDLAEELPRVGGERLDVAPLSLGVEGVEGQRRLAGAGGAGEDHQPVLGNPRVDLLQVVLGRSADLDELAPTPHRLLGIGPVSGLSPSVATPGREG
jgi:hypothetical protein